MLVRLLGPGGPDLRQFYLPGLEGLKQQLRMLEWLMERVMGRLKDYLEARLPRMTYTMGPPCVLVARWRRA